MRVLAVRHASIASAVATALLATVAPGSASAAEPTCVDTLMADWQDGRIDGVYAPGCYRAALEALPEDVRAYSAAEADITRALRATLRRTARAPANAAPRRLAQRPATETSRPGQAKTRETRERGVANEPPSKVLRSPPLAPLVAAAIGLALCLAGAGAVLARHLRTRRRARQTIGRRRPHPIH